MGNEQSSEPISTPFFSEEDHPMMRKDKSNLYKPLIHPGLRGAWEEEKRKRIEEMRNSKPPISNKVIRQRLDDWYRINSWDGPATLTTPSEGSTSNIGFGLATLSRLRSDVNGKSGTQKSKKTDKGTAKPKNRVTMLPRYQWPTISSRKRQREIVVPVTYPPRLSTSQQPTTTHGMTKEQKAKWWTGLYVNKSHEQHVQAEIQRGRSMFAIIDLHEKHDANVKLAERIMKAKPKVSTRWSHTPGVIETGGDDSINTPQTRKYSYDYIYDYLPL